MKYAYLIGSVSCCVIGGALAGSNVLMGDPTRMWFGVILSAVGVAGIYMSAQKIFLDTEDN